MKAKKETLNLAQAKELTTDVYSKYKTLFNGLPDELAKELERELNDHSDLGDVYDQIALMEEFLIAKTDGRPQPLDMSITHGYPNDLIEKMSAEQREDMLQENHLLRRWAECASPGYETMAYINKKELSKNELLQLRDWIDQVIAWHSQSGKKKQLGGLS